MCVLIYINHRNPEIRSLEAVGEDGFRPAQPGRAGAMDRGDFCSGQCTRMGV
jgi:hypothetical protein